MNPVKRLLVSLMLVNGIILINVITSANGTVTDVEVLSISIEKLTQTRWLIEITINEPTAGEFSVYESGILIGELLPDVEFNNNSLNGEQRYWQIVESLEDGLHTFEIRLTTSVSIRTIHNYTIRLGDITMTEQVNVWLPRILLIVILLLKVVIPEKKDLEAVETNMNAKH